MKSLQIVATIIIFSIGFIIGYGVNMYEKIDNTINTINETQRSIEDKISDYDCIIRNSTNSDSIRYYQQKKELLMYELYNKGKERWQTK